MNDFQADTSGTYEITIQNSMSSKTIQISGSIKVK